MKEVFTLEHSYEIDNIEEIKFIGIYSSKEEANKAIERLKLKPGFTDRPNGFNINKYEINKDDWREGFSTLNNIKTKDINGKWKTVQAEKLITGNYQIIELYENHLLGDFKNQDIVRCELRNKILYVIEKMNE